MKISDNGITRYISDGLGNVIAEIDGVGLLQNKYVYGNGQKLVKLKRNYVVPVGSLFEKRMETEADFNANYGQSASFSTSSDRKEGNSSVLATLIHDGNTHSESRLNTFVEYTASDYPYVHVWVKPLDNADWIEFFVLDVPATGGGTDLLDQIQGDMDGDGKFEVGTDLVAGTWNELWLDLRNVVHYTSNHADPGDSRVVSEFHIHTNVPPIGGNPVKFLWDHVYATDEPYTVN